VSWDRIEIGTALPNRLTQQLKNVAQRRRHSATQRSCTSADPILKSMPCILLTGASTSYTGPGADHRFKTRTSIRPLSSKLIPKEWLPGMDSNHELDKILKSHNLLIPKSH
jgi:hypothetical protein